MLVILNCCFCQVECKKETKKSVINSVTRHDKLLSLSKKISDGKCKTIEQRNPSTDFLLQNLISNF